MSNINISEIGPCNSACTKIVKFLTDREIQPNIGISIPPYTDVDGYRYINLFVQFTQEAADEPPVGLGVIFAFDSNGTMGARCYVNMEENATSPQDINFISVSGQSESGQGSWHGSPHNISSYLARFPVMGPYIEVFIYNRAAVDRTVSVWGYLIS